MTRKLQHWIGGRPAGPADGRTFESRNPATGEVIAHVARGGAADIDRAVHAAEGALSGAWGRRAAAERADLLDAIADGLHGRLDELAELESRDSGKTLTQARNIDIPRAVANFRFFAGAIRHDETGFHPMQGAFNYTLRKPVGVVGLITPWNLPLYLLTWKVAPALAMGNAVVAKPSELTPMTATVLAEILQGAGVPAGAFNLVHGLGPEAGQALVEHPGVRGISFTGGTRTGAAVASTAAPHFKKVSLELGGKNATLVFADSDFERALRGSIRAGMTNQGQVCLSGSRILVERSIHTRFVDALAERVRAMRVGDPADPATEMGALVSHEHREKVEGYLELARQEGGTILCGGKRPDLPPPFDQGAFVEPTVITGLPADSRTATEEIFGPVVTVHPFEGESEAVAIANSVRYGLCASVWTKDLDRAHRLGRRLETGMIWVNTWLLRDLRVPFGGVKDSGIGREGGKWSLEFFSEATNVCVALEEENRA
jgi:aminomuconate-semialdehyde/2-hydroxymuconate-6-semialdehyde dehydrogenase